METYSADQPESQKITKYKNNNPSIADEIILELNKNKFSKSFVYYNFTNYDYGDIQIRFFKDRSSKFNILMSYITIGISSIISPPVYVFYKDKRIKLKMSDVRKLQAWFNQNSKSLESELNSEFIKKLKEG